jgi:hypothetical protein
MEDKKSQKAPTIDSVIVTSPDIIQLPKIEVKEVVSDEGADTQEASATEAKVPESEQRTSPVITTAPLMPERRTVLSGCQNGG